MARRRLPRGLSRSISVEREAGTEMIAIARSIRTFVEEAALQALQAAGAGTAGTARGREAALENPFPGRGGLRLDAHSGLRRTLHPQERPRLSPCPNKDRRWDMFRIETVEDDGKLVGTYRTRGDATKALTQLAYQPEPRWLSEAPCPGHRAQPA